MPSKEAARARRIAGEFAEFVKNPALTPIMGNAVHIQAAQVTNTAAGNTLDAIVGLLDTTHPKRDLE